MADPIIVSDEERRTFAEGAGFVYPEAEPGQKGQDAQMDDSAPDFDAMIYALVSTYFNAGPTAYAELVDDHRSQLTIACALHARLKQILLIGLRMGAEEGDGACANELGALYYTGDIVEQDYAKAARYYEIAAEAGYVQAMVNLGYLYEYGRLGSSDFAKAYMYYSFAAAVYEQSEALCKMGDMFSQGKGVQLNMQGAIALWQRSFDVATDEEQKAQPAFRMAQVLVDAGECEKLGIRFDPLAALQLFQTAEVGLRISVQKGLQYYSKRLQEAIEGQSVARALLDE